MRLTLTAVLAGMIASPALAAGDVFFSLKNTDFVVLLAFILFIAVLFYFKVPSLLGGMLDKRADTIKSELEEARALREEAQTLLASYERKQKEVQDQADRIVTAAKEEAKAAAAQAQVDLAKSLERRMAAAEDQITSAQAAAVKEVRDQAVTIAIAAARDVIAKQMTATDGNKLIDDAIVQVGDKLH
ncbi:F0F1 ATP synthase subunit B [Sulfitobacter mediterraneus]|jgi:F-type H+-transporting ATPase subunit b|uniref:F0F1 ATP synthase subunit B n=1 Tax=Sulfitobacter TaxID=60136 RepID=UPI001933B28C|nr:MULTISPECIES: F0F1 ATP synthase subunit B [Sulfitobacter]MBM1633393.1 F0F1 ATP synthase subunit B [Sulfitobacter mediterraneus]MBM1640473.1 F0F1 ATP synthase subunit B [Sulfitobacter mediterraneus]MBM1645258.1 F0F1 ATP synthase subunit B [Sulfitobacter mediterraneus]MBM1648593.1 F0F1 ATP synthase subunit B [Sulfitobacter mediterraneus]MBM1652613.1 F0F1 ATP synthase subunit B [Sulfitobacter mediterraneus]